MEQETHKNVVALDSLVQDRQLQMIKASLPYINNSSQRTMAFLIKFLELERTMSIFNRPEATIQMCAPQEEEESRSLQMLAALREFCTRQEQETIDMLINYMQMFSAYETLFT